MRIFFSYGHDTNEALVRRIQADLEQRGHDVWFDKSDIKAGDDWRRAITDGIADSDRVLVFLSVHSTRDPGVCLDEIAIAIGVKGGNIQTVLVESETDVKPPASISYVQWLDMHDWKEQRAAGEAAWEEWYRAKLAELARALESDESRRFAGEIETLSGHLDPISPESRIVALLGKGFVGRKWLIEAVEHWRSAEDRTSRLFWIVGDPGVGKSAFAAHLTHFGRDKVIAAQFVEWDKPDHRNAQRIVRSLAFQLATRLPDYRKLLLSLPEKDKLDRKGPAELFDYLLANPLRAVIHGGRERYLIVIDALDEAGEAGRNPLVEMLAHNTPRLPDWIGLVVTSRPESAVKTPLQGLHPTVLDAHTQANRSDIRDYLRRELASQLDDRPDADRLVAQILEKSEGVFLYVERVCHDLQQGHLSFDGLDLFPQGLGGVFAQFFQRQFPDLDQFRKEVRPALRAILAAREPLPLEILQRLFNWPDEDLRDFARTLGALFPAASAGAASTIAPYHKSIADWLTDEAKAGPYFVSALEGHRLLGELCFRHWRDGPLFAVLEVIYHLQFDATPAKLLRVLFAPAYYETKLARCGLTKLFDDLKCVSALPLDESAQIPLDACLPEVKALHSIATLIVSNGICDTLMRDPSRPNVPAGVAVLRRFVESGCDPELLEIAREKLRPQISRAELAPRSYRKESSHWAASTAHFYQDYVEHWLRAEDAALALRPGQMIAHIEKALRFYAIYSCDGDPLGAPNVAIEETEKDLDARLPVLKGFALLLNAGVAILGGSAGKKEDG